MESDMTRLEFQNLLSLWCQSTELDSLEIQELKRDIEFLEHVLYNDYTPTSQGRHLDFGGRLSAWIGNLNDEADQQTLLTIFRYLLFISRDNFEASHRTVFSKNVVKWMMDINNLNVFDVNTAQTLTDCLNSTRYSQITGSFRLQEFIRINGLDGQPRYTWLEHFDGWNRNNFCRDYLNIGTANPIQYLVLFEDFVGSGSQMSDILELAIRIPNVNILLCPLFICPGGKTVAEHYAALNPRLTYSPLLELSPNYLVGPAANINEPEGFAAIRELITRIHPRVAGGQQEYGPFGFGETGALVVKHDNCPDNTIPVIHKPNLEEWSPVFYRVPREQN